MLKIKLIFTNNNRLKNKYFVVCCTIPNGMNVTRQVYVDDVKWLSQLKCIDVIFYSLIDISLCIGKVIAQLSDNMW